MSPFPQQGPKPPRKAKVEDDLRPALTVELIPDRSVVGTTPAETRRVNLKAMVALGVAALLAPILYFAIATVQDGRLRRFALEQAAESADGGNVDKAILGLEHFLARWPDDIPGLELMAKLRSEGARSLDELMMAADAQDRLLRVDPSGPDRQANRRKLVELYVRWSDALRQVTSNRNLSIDKTQSRSRAAVKIAEQILAFGADDAESHRLLAMALESLASTGDPNALGQSVLEYEKALRRDAGDAASAERLARIVLEREGATAGADEILAELLQAAPKSVDARMVRYRSFAATDRPDKARLELEEATKLAPADPGVRLAAAIEAIRRRDTAAARRHLEAIPAASKDNRRVAMLWGFIDLADAQADVAVDVWRKGLIDSGGSDRELTWRLAYTLIQLGRFAEADPLVAQYRRLAGDESAMYRFLKGIQAEAMGRPSAAIAEMEGLRGSVDKAWQPELAMTLGRAFEKIHDEGRAMIEFREAIKGSPRLVAGWRSLARLVRRTDPEKAAQEVEAGLLRLPGEPALLLDLAAIRLDQQLAQAPADRDWRAVNDAVDRATRAAPAGPDLLKIRAQALLAAGKPDEALGLLEQAVEGPDRARDDLWIARANALAGRGRPEEALKALERGSATDRAGDRASLRIARAQLLLQLGRGRAARDLLTQKAESLAVPEQVELARARSKVLQVLGDKAGAREACLDWARLAPLEPQAGLALLGLSQQNNDEEAARLGLEILRKVGGEDEPYALAGRALDLLRSNRSMAETRTARLEKAAELGHKLMVLAPKLPVSRLVRGMILERNHRIEEAIVDYQVALEGGTGEMALTRLTQLYTRLKRFDDLAALKKKSNAAIAFDQAAARLAIEQGDKEGAEKVLARLVEGRPDDPDAQATFAAYLRELGKPEAAEQALRAMVDRVRHRPDAWVALAFFQAGQGATAEVAKTIERASAEYHGERPDLLMARLRWIAGEREAAAKLYDEAIAAHPADLITCQAACAFFDSTGRPDRAEALLRKALKVPASAPWAAKTLAMLLARRPDPATWKEAWGLIAPGGPGAGETPADRLMRASLLALSPDPSRRAEASAVLAALIDDLPVSHPVAARARVSLATTLFQSGKADEAARYIAPATEEGIATDPASLALAVEILARAGQPDEADQRLSRLAAAEPDSARSACGRAWVFQSRGKSAEAVATIEDAAAAAEKAPDAVLKHALYFNQLLAMKQPEAAERLARKVARLWPRDAGMLAEFLLGRGRIDEALDACKLAADAGANREPIRLAAALVMAGRLDKAQGEKARAIAEAVVDRQPKGDGLMLLAVSIANRQGRYDDALKVCRRAFELDPANPNCRRSLNDMAWIFSEELGRPADALPEIDKVLKLEAIPSAMDTRGVILTRLGRLDEAIDQLERCLKLEPVGHRFLHLARAFQLAGKADQYKGTLDRAKKAGIRLEALTPKEREEFAAVIAR